MYTGLHAWTTKWQVEDQCCSRTGKVKKNHNILRKNTIFNEHPVSPFNLMNTQLTPGLMMTVKSVEGERSERTSWGTELVVLYISDVMFHANT